MRVILLIALVSTAAHIGVLHSVARSTPPTVIAARPDTLPIRVDRADIQPIASRWAAALGIAVRSISTNKREIFAFGLGRHYGLAALSLLSGKLLWVGQGQFVAGVASDNVVYALKSDDSQGSNADLVAIDATLGRFRHVTRIADCGRIIGLHAIDNVVIAVCADRVVAIYRAHGGIAWNTHAVSNYFGYNAFATRGKIAVLSENPRAEGNPASVDGIDIGSGRIVWRSDNVSFAYATADGIYLNDLTPSDTGAAHTILVDWQRGSQKRSFLAPFPQPQRCNSCSSLVDFPYALFYIAGLSPGVQSGRPDTRFLVVNMVDPSRQSFLIDPKGYPIGQTPEGDIIIDSARSIGILKTKPTLRLTTNIPGSRATADKSISIGRPPFQRVLSYDDAFTYIDLPNTRTIGSFHAKCTPGSATVSPSPAGLILYCARRLGDVTASTFYLLH